MEVTLHIPDEIAAHLTQDGGDLARRALESFAIEELRAGRITEQELRKMLGLARIQMDGFLKSHGIYQDYTLRRFRTGTAGSQRTRGLAGAVGNRGHRPDQLSDPDWHCRASAPPVRKSRLIDQRVVFACPREERPSGYWHTGIPRFAEAIRKLELTIFRRPESYAENPAHQYKGAEIP